MTYFHNSTPVIIGVMILFVVLGVTFLIMSPVQRINETGLPEGLPTVIHPIGILIIIIVSLILIIAVNQSWFNVGKKDKKEDDKHEL